MFTKSSRRRAFLGPLAEQISDRHDRLAPSVDLAAIAKLSKRQIGVTHTRLRTGPVYRAYWSAHGSEIKLKGEIEFGRPFASTCV